MKKDKASNFLKALRASGCVVLLLVTWSLTVFHRGVFPTPDAKVLKTVSGTPGVWIDKSKFGMHQLILEGSPYERGLEAGKLTGDLLLRQEQTLVDQLRQFIPSPFVLKVLDLLIIRWFWGIEPYFEPWTVQEMYGISKSAPEKFNDLADPFTRQIAYHGLHEVSQMTVDLGGDSMGCTVVAVPLRDSWVLGRNFDFEAGRIFDSEKILKWVFPSEGYSYVSVIWAGMVGAVTGVNEHGLYVSLNAAGSTDFRRYGTPSTLILLKALQFSKTAAEAVKMIQQETMFITDIFVVLDGKSGELYRVEKSPKQTVVLPLKGPSIVTNHLLAAPWERDSINSYRRDELTSHVRAIRGAELLAGLPPFQSSNSAEKAVLEILRDKGAVMGKALTLGNRRAIDALIATHSVVYNPTDAVLYVSQGPGVSGPFTGFDLKASFASRHPVQSGSFPRDPQVSDEAFLEVRKAGKEISRAERVLARGLCDQAGEILKSPELKFRESSAYYSTLGNYLKCKGDLEGARSAWRNALNLYPAYKKQVRSLQERIMK